MGAFTVPRIALGPGILEGGGQTINIETLTQRSADPGRVLMGAAMGGASAGVFTAVQSALIPYGGGIFARGAGYAFDFPGEPAGDIAESVISRAAGRSPGLRMPVLTLTETPSVTAKTRASVYTQTQPNRAGIISSLFAPSTNIPGVGRVPVDEFGLPNMARNTTTNKPSDFTPGGFSAAPLTFAPTKASTQGDVFNTSTSTGAQSIYTNINETVHVATSTTTNVGTSVSVPALTPTGFPFFPSGRLGQEGRGGGGGKDRLGYFDELSAAMTGLNPRTMQPIREPRAKAPARKPRAQGNKTMFRSGSMLGAFNAWFPSTKKRTTPKRSGVFPAFAIRL